MVAQFTDKQVTDYVLCAKCEQLFGEVENWVVQRCLQQEGNFPLCELVLAAPLAHGDTELSAVAAKSITGFDVQKLAYFAASVLWRTSVHVWHIGGSQAAIDLGPYTEEFRRYLLNEGAFPDDVVLGIFIATKADATDQFATTPVPLKVDGYLQYDIVIPGLKFTMMLGKMLPDVARLGCSLRSTENLIYLTDHIERRALAHLMRNAKIATRLREQAALNPGRKP
jgi:hypothetical protein